MLDHHDVEQFLYREARLMDTHAYADWLALWAREAHYWIPCNADDVDVSRHVSLVNEDRAGLEDRIRRLQSGAHYAQDPVSRLARVVSNVDLERFRSENPYRFPHLDSPIARLAMNSRAEIRLYVRQHPAN